MRRLRFHLRGLRVWVWRLWKGDNPCPECGESRNAVSSVCWDCDDLSDVTVRFL